MTISVPLPPLTVSSELNVVISFTPSVTVMIFATSSLPTMVELAPPAATSILTFKSAKLFGVKSILSPSKRAT